MPRIPTSPTLPTTSGSLKQDLGCWSAVEATFADASTHARTLAAHSSCCCFLVDTSPRCPARERKITLQQEASRNLHFFLTTPCNEVHGLSHSTTRPSDNVESTSCLKSPFSFFWARLQERKERVGAAHSGVFKGTGHFAHARSTEKCLFCSSFPFSGFF